METRFGRLPFNTYISKGYLTWVAPLVLAHRLANTTNGSEGTNTHLDIRLVKPSAWKFPNGQTPSDLLKVSFICAEVLPECKQVRLIVTRKGESIADALDDLLQRQECEILRCTLVRGLGEAYFDKQADNDERAPKTARKRTPKAKRPVDDGKADTAKRSGKRKIDEVDGVPTNAPKRRRGRPPKRTDLIEGDSSTAQSQEELARLTKLFREGKLSHAN